MSRSSAHFTLFGALLLVSTAGPFLLGAHVDAFSAVFVRMGASAVVYLAWAALGGALRVDPRQLPRIALGALLLGGHFALWVKAFDLTDFASNHLLLVAQPVIAALVGARLGERAARGTWPAVALAVVGLAILAGGDFALGPKALLGDLLCVVAGLSITLFYALTREARAVTPLPTFMGLTMLLGALGMAPLVLVSGSRLAGYPATSWAWLAALVLLTTVGGHGLMNVAARHVKLFTLNVVIVLEPPIAIGLGALLFGTTITGLQLVAGVILAAAVVVGMRPEREVAAPPWLAPG